MKFRLSKAVLVIMVLILLSGCSSIGDTANCSEQYRDITIDDITHANQDAQFNLAGKITEKRPEQDWVLITDGTGIAKVHEVFGGNLMSQPTNTCLEFTARVGSVTDGGNVDVIMYLGKYVGS